jgi:hypothetical protein
VRVGVSTRRRLAATMAALTAAVGGITIGGAAPAQAASICTAWEEVPWSGVESESILPYIFSQACVEQTGSKYVARLYVKSFQDRSRDYPWALDYLKVNARVELHGCDGVAISAAGYFDTNPPAVSNKDTWRISTSSAPSRARGFKVNYRVKSLYWAENGEDAAGGGTSNSTTC